MTFDEMRTETIRAAQDLQARGYTSKQSFALLARNNHHVASIAFASLALACPLHCLDPLFGKAEMICHLNLSKPVVMFCDIAYYELLNECLLEMGIETKLFSFGGSQGRSEPNENLLIETNKEDQFT